MIVAGHSRYLALRELGWREAMVIVLDLSEREAKAYRIIDNKTHEFARWTPELQTELRELGDVDMQSFFLEDLNELVAASLGASGIDEVTQEQVERSEDKMIKRFGHNSEVYKAADKQMICPACGHEFYITGS